MDSASQAAAPLSIIKGVPLEQEPGIGALTLPGFLREVTDRFAGREALVLHTPDGAVRWSYALLWDRALEVARALRACGVGKDSRVGILMTNRPEWIAAFFGVGLTGGVAVALSTFSTTCCSSARSRKRTWPRCSASWRREFARPPRANSYR
jgi:fatty-acyl-CoA synthase